MGKCSIIPALDDRASDGGGEREKRIVDGRLSQRGAMKAFLRGENGRSRDGWIVAMGGELYADGTVIARNTGTKITVMECVEPWIAGRVHALRREMTG